MRFLYLSDPRDKLKSRQGSRFYHLAPTGLPTNYESDLKLKTDICSCVVKIGKRSYSNLVTQRNNNLNKHFYSTCSSVNKSNLFHSK